MHWRVHGSSLHTLPFRLGVANPVRSHDITVIAGDLDAMTAGGAIAAVAFERADPSGLAAHRIERIEAGELDVEFRSGVLVEGIKRPACRRIPFAVDLANAASDSLQFGLQQSGNILQHTLV